MEPPLLNPSSLFSVPRPLFLPLYSFLTPSPYKLALRPTLLILIPSHEAHDVPLWAPSLVVSPLRPTFLSSYLNPHSWSISPSQSVTQSHISTSERSWSLIVPSPQPSASPHCPQPTWTPSLQSPHNTFPIQTPNYLLPSQSPPARVPTCPHPARWARQGASRRQVVFPWGWALQQVRETFTTSLLYVNVRHCVIPVGGDKVL